MDPLQWMGAVRMRVQTADKNITIIHTTPVHRLTSWEAKHCMFVINKSIKTFFCPQFIILLSPLKKPESGEKYAQIKHHLKVKTVPNSSKQNTWVYFHVRGQQEMDFFIEGSIIMDFGQFYGLYFGQKRRFKVKNFLTMDLFLTNTQFFSWTAVVWINCGLL